MNINLAIQTLYQKQSREIMTPWYNLSDKQKLVRRLWGTPIVVLIFYLFLLYFQSRLQDGTLVVSGKRQAYATLIETMLGIMPPLAWAGIFFIVMIIEHIYIYKKYQHKDSEKG